MQTRITRCCFPQSYQQFSLVRHLKVETQDFKLSMKILIYSSNSGKQRPEPVEYVPGWQRLQEPASGAPASTVLQHRTEPKIGGSGQATLHTGNLIQSSMFPPGTDGMRQMWLRLL